MEAHFCNEASQSNAFKTHPSNFTFQIAVVAILFMKRWVTTICQRGRLFLFSVAEGRLTPIGMLTPFDGQIGNTAFGEISTCIKNAEGDVIYMGTTKGRLFKLCESDVHLSNRRSSTGYQLDVSMSEIIFG